MDEGWSRAIAATSHTAPCHSAIVDPAAASLSSALFVSQLPPCFSLLAFRATCSRSLSCSLRGVCPPTPCRG